MVVEDRIEKEKAKRKLEQEAIELKASIKVLSYKTNKYNPFMTSLVTLYFGSLPVLFHIYHSDLGDTFHGFYHITFLVKVFV